MSGNSINGSVMQNLATEMSLSNMNDEILRLRAECAKWKPTFASEDTELGYKFIMIVGGKKLDIHFSRETINNTDTGSLVQNLADTFATSQFYEMLKQELTPIVTNVQENSKRLTKVGKWD